MKRGAWGRPVSLWGPPCAGVSLAALAGCIDLFHSTDFGSCTSCGDAASLDGSRDSGVDAPRDGRTPDSAARDAKGDGALPIGDGGNAGKDVTQPHDAALADTGFDAGHDASHFVDANFCTMTTPSPASKAEHACLWLGACLGTSQLNDFGACYPAALSAYDCSLNPDLEVTGPLHAFWNALWQAQSCHDVIAAVLPNGPSTCSNPAATCGTDLDGGAAASAVAVTCTASGAFASAVNCDMAGLTCVAGTCALQNPQSCPGQPACDDGGVFHWCASEPPRDGGTGVTRDVGRSCTHIGAGGCYVDEGTFAGCLPSPDAASCTDPSGVAACGGESVNEALACIGGREAEFVCSSFLAGEHCNSSLVGSVPVSDPARLCTPGSGAGMAPSCDGGVNELAGPAGYVRGSCQAVGLGGCVMDGGAPHCVSP